LYDLLTGSIIEGEEVFLFLADEHEAVIVIVLLLGGEFDIGDDEVIVLVLDECRVTCSSFVLNHSLAWPSLTGIYQIILLE
jgi:hypothetical protein